MVTCDPLAFWISWNKTASQADDAGRPPSSFLFLLSKDEPAREGAASERVCRVGQ